MNFEIQDGDSWVDALENIEDCLENLEYKIFSVMVDYKKGLMVYFDKLLNYEIK